MSYTALYRKFRPQEFEDVKGQEHIVTTLQNQIKADRVGHAYLFCGTRGTGKTTVAKIFARAVNCENPSDGSPCGDCPSCRAIAAGNSMNVIEIDAASNNGVDQVRALRDEAVYSPAEGRYKVYIIDEVHMLSIGAFNALLKTLEEPPSYVIFILATTEAHKIPITILSRCQRYDFRRITIGTIAGRLEELMEKEQVEVEEKAIRYIARAADGSMRDALSLLDQCIAFYLGEKLTYDHVLEVLGAVDTEMFSRMLRRILAQDVPGAMQLLEELIVQGREPGQFVMDFTWYLRNLLLLQGSEHMEDVLDVSTENLLLLKEEAQMADPEQLMRYIRIFSDLSNQVRYAVQKRILVEIALIKLCRPQMERDYDSLAGRITLLEEKLDKGIFVKPSTDGAQEKALPQGTAQEGNAFGKGQREQAAQREKAIPEDVRKVVQNWRSIVQDLPGGLKPYLKTARLELSKEGGLLIFLADHGAGGFAATESHRQDIVEAIANRTGKEVEVAFRLQDLQETGSSAEQGLDLQKLINMPIMVEE